jgi:hypothetical protein
MKELYRRIKARDVCPARNRRLDLQLVDVRLSSHIFAKRLVSSWQAEINDIKALL